MSTLLTITFTTLAGDTVTTTLDMLELVRSIAAGVVTWSAVDHATGTTYVLGLGEWLTLAALRG